MWCCGKRGDSDLEAERNRHSRASIRKTPDDQDCKMIQQVEEGTVGFSTVMTIKLELIKQICDRAGLDKLLFTIYRSCSNSSLSGCQTRFSSSDGYSFLPVL